MKQANGAEYYAGWVAGWDAAMAHVHATVGAALGLNGRRSAPVDPSPEYGASCDLCGHSDYCDGRCSPETEELGHG